MPRVLTVDDSRAVRSLVVRQLGEWGIEADEAEDGVRGLQKLQAGSYDLVLLDVSMPEMDGPTMLAKLRESGNRTPVLMLTSESKTSIVAGAMKAGIEDYILKPFKPEELLAKLRKVLKGFDGGGASRTAANGDKASGAAEDGERAAVDVLLVDDMDTVHAKLRSVLPQAISMDACGAAQAALQHARHRVYRVIIVDGVIPGVNSVALMHQIRALQGRATILCLCLRTAENLLAEARRQGFDGVLFKPFTQEGVDELIAQHLDTAELVIVEGNAMRIAEWVGRDENVARYYRKLTDSMKGRLPAVAEACFDAVDVDAVKLRLHEEHTLKLFIALRDETARLGIGLRVRGSKRLGTLMAEVADTNGIPFEVAA